MPERAKQHGVHAWRVVAALAGLALVIALVCAATYRLARLWGMPLAGPNAPMDVPIPGARLQSAPQRENARLAADRQRSLQRFEWVDRSQGIARIPIDDAMRVLAGAPRPARPAERSDAAARPVERSDATARPVERSDATARPAERGDATARPAAVADVAQRLGTRLPLDARFVDDAGNDATLSRYFGEVPVILVFGYHRCPNLCSTLMESVLLSLSAAGLSRDDYRVLAISVDAREGPADAAPRAHAYRTAFPDAPLHLLTGEAAQSARVADAVGVSFAFDPTTDGYAHPLALVVATPDGRLSRYFGGVQFDPRALRLALVEASAGRTGTLTDQVFLRCAHFDPQTGRYTVAALSFVRGGCALVAGGLGIWLWRRRRGHHRWAR